MRPTRLDLCLMIGSDASGVGPFLQFEIISGQDPANLPATGVQA